MYMYIQVMESLCKEIRETRDKRLKLERNLLYKGQRDSEQNLTQANKIKY